MEGPRYLQRIDSTAVQRFWRDGVHHRGGVQAVRRHIELDEVYALPGQTLAQITDDPIGHAHRHQAQGDRSENPSFAWSGHRDVGEFTSERGISGILAMHESQALVEVQRVDDIALALM